VATVARRRLAVGGEPLGKARELLVEEARQGQPAVAQRAIELRVEAHLAVAARPRLLPHVREQYLQRGRHRRVGIDEQVVGNLDGQRRRVLHVQAVVLAQPPRRRRSGHRVDHAVLAEPLEKDLAIRKPRFTQRLDELRQPLLAKGEHDAPPRARAPVAEQRHEVGGERAQLLRRAGASLREHLLRLVEDRHHATIGALEREPRRAHRGRVGGDVGA
jgi:hypothetical protein